MGDDGTTILRCACCGNWTVDQIQASFELGRPPVTMLRVRHFRYHVGTYRDVKQVQKVLAEAGVDWASLQPEEE